MLPKAAPMDASTREKSHLFIYLFFLKTTPPPGNSHATRRGATACNTEGTRVGEIASIVYSSDWAGVGREMRGPTEHGERGLGTRPPAE
jgi:hypothetical protein